MNLEMKMTYYPVIIPTLNRYQHFKECVKSLAACTHADKTELVIGLDYPPSEKYVEGWKQIKTYIPTITGFAKVTVFEHDHNLGPAGNSNALEQYVTGKYDAWIYTEDDNVFSPCFLDYMDKCLEKYKDDETVLAISGYMNSVTFPVTVSKKASIVRMQDYMAWGIGVWKRTKKELADFMPAHYMHYVCSHKNILKKMKPYLRDLYQLIFWTKGNPELDRQCDFTIACYCKINNKYIINPAFSLVRNMGYDGTGVNCGVLDDNYLAKQPISSDKLFDLQDNLTENEFMQCREIWETYKSKDFSKKQKKLVLQYYNAYMFFGYRLGDFILSSNTSLVRSAKKIIKFLIPHRIILLYKQLRNR